MIREGNKTTFEHVARKDNDGPLVIVEFDGEPEMWWVKTTADQAIKELQEYYYTDWKDSNRVIPIKVYHLVRRDSVNCLDLTPKDTLAP